MSDLSQHKPYVPVARHVMERLEIAALTGEYLQLQWAEENSHQAHLQTVFPQALEEQQGALYLLARGQDNEELKIRLDLIRNLPTPVK